ncbi:hypothetical protein Sjap_021144 [Stephania japonica]|uniref:Uncharacterized protein n=1 Tax=Stephania japonica TaxID=461633 RepID=A0AAP0I0Z6_9MAGN
MALLISNRRLHTPKRMLHLQSITTNLTTSPQRPPTIQLIKISLPPTPEADNSPQPKQRQQKCQLTHNVLLSSSSPSSSSSPWSPRHHIITGRTTNVTRPSHAAVDTTNTEHHK